jgi:AraC-like DNA-binding protein
MEARHGISVATLRPLADMLRQLDVDPATFLAEVGVDAAMPPNTYVAAAGVDRALDEIAARRGDTAFAITLARTAAVRPLGLFGHMVWLSGSVRDALARAVKFWAIVSRRSTLSFAERDGVAIVRQHPTVPGEPRGRILVEFPFASLAIRAREATRGEFALRAVRFAHAGQASAAYTDMFRAPVTFGADYDELEIASSQLDLRMATSDPITSEVLEARVAQLIDTRRDPFIERVRRAAEQDFEGASSPTVVAKRMGISARTLRRHLEQQGQTLRGVVDGVRRERADQLLDAGMSVKEIAFALGFSEPSAFSRAYKRWTGRAPRDA